MNNRIPGSSDKYSALVNNIRQGFCILKIIYDHDMKPVNFRIVETNSVFEKHTGLFKPSGKTMNDFAPFHEESWFRIFSKVAKSGNSVRFEFKDDHVPGGLWYDIHAFRLVKSFDNLVAVLFNDITDRKKAEAALLEVEGFNNLLKQITERTNALAESKGLLKSVLANTSSSIMAIKPVRNNKNKITDFEYLFTNDQVLKTFGKELLIGKKMLEEFPLMKNSELFRRFVKVVESGSDYQGELNLNSYGHALWTQLYARKMGDGCLITYFDITERKKAEEALGRKESAYRVERSRNRALKRMIDLMDTFIFSAAHDLKAPVSNLKLVTDLISGTNDKELKIRLQEKYEPIIETLDVTLSGLIRVLEIEQDLNPVIKELRIRTVLDFVLKEMNENISSIKPSININIPKSCEDISYVESYMISILRNLLSNALKYRSDKRRLVINIRMRRSGKFVIMTFSDNGIGIDLKQYRHDLFKPFRRLDSSAEGSGLGLHLIQSIITKNGGKIETGSKIGHGTTFKLSLIEYKIKK